MSIIGILSSDARIPLTRIAKKVKLSRDAVKYRIDQYEKRGIIQGYRTVVDIKKFGYDKYHLFLKLNNPSSSIEEKLRKKFVSYPFTRAVIKFSGNYDYELAIVAKDIQELDKIISKIIEDCSSSLHESDLLLLPKTYIAETFPPNFPGHIQNKSSQYSSNQKIDKKDIEILKILGDSAKTPLHELETKVKLSADAISYRIKNMIKSGTIIKFVPVINYTSLNYNLHTLLLNISSFDEKKEKILKDFLQIDKNTLWATKTIGKYNVLIYLLVKNVDELQETLIKLRGLFPAQINHYETLIAYEEYKYIYFPKELF